MPDERWQHVQNLFEDALSRPADSREAFLDSACGDDPALRAEVESLLQHDEKASSGFLQPRESPPVSQLNMANPAVGELVGQYEIKSVIAVGGMATVFEAEQQRPKRIVALKLLRTDLPSRSRLRRFDYEAEILARLQHPNIAQIYEAGTYPDSFGRTLPYFAMEYVKGAQPITTHAKQKGLENRERLELFAQVCDAVHHGHQKGVIHRDLKPANILVDAGGQVKVIDFGVSRATDSGVVTTTMRTNVGALIGTLEYMSPEQCGADPLDLDVRSDVYSLGVILFELLTGCLPYNLTRRPIPSAVRVICESEPTRPSTIDRKLRGDLEIIVLTALRKDRSRRYQSAWALGDDIKRCIRHEPISAKPSSRWTKVVHWVSRHPRLSTVCACVLIAGAILGGALAADSVFRRRPNSLELNGEKSTATLFAASGNVLHEWSSQRHGIWIATLINRPAEFGGGRLAAVGFTANDLGPYSGQLCLFDPSGKLDEPIWHVGVVDDDIPTKIKEERHFTGKDFGTRSILQADIFPNVPGSELVVVHQHNDYTHTVLRIYNPFSKQENEKPLYETWVDAYLPCLYWMSDARLLVAAGLNGAAFWTQRGFGPFKYQHPRVVFALRPELGFRSKDYLREQPGTDQGSPIWYRCVGPPEASNLDIRMVLYRPYGSSLPGSSVALLLEFLTEQGGAGLSFVINAQGDEVPATRITADEYKLNRARLPDENFMQLQDLPPVRPEWPDPASEADGATAPTNNSRP